MKSTMHCYGKDVPLDGNCKKKKKTVKENPRCTTFIGYFLNFSVNFMHLILSFCKEIQAPEIKKNYYQGINLTLT